MVVSSLVATGGEPRRSIGSANLAEFFVMVAISVTFLFHLDLAQYGRIVLGLVTGGAIAAPMAGYLIRIMPQKLVLGLVGAVVPVQAVIGIHGLFSARGIDAPASGFPAMSRGRCAEFRNAEPPRP